jgi:LacI family transcriptional regulator
MSIPDSADRDRQEGYRVAMASAGLIPELLMLYRRPDLMRVQLLDIFRRPAPPTAILSCHHFLTRELLSVLRQMGIAIPGQISLIGFDSGDDEFAPGCKLANVELDPFALGRRAGIVLRQQIESPGIAIPGREILPVRIQDHDSLAPCQEPPHEQA